MTEFEEKISNLIKYLEDIPVIAEVITDEEMDTQFPEKVRKQLAEGEDSNGTDIQIGYSNMWANVRDAEGLQTDYVDLYFSGEFYRSLETFEVGNEYFLDSTTTYASEIYSRYPNILGLQDANLQIIIEDIKKRLIKELKNGR